MLIMPQGMQNSTMQNYQNQNPSWFQRYFTPENQQALINAGAAMSMASAPSFTPSSGNFANAMSQGLIGFQQGQQQYRNNAYDQKMKEIQTKRLEEEQERREKINDITDNESLIGSMNPIQKQVLSDALLSGDSKTVMSLISPPSSTMFEGTGIEAQMLNRYLDSLPPEQRRQVADELAVQRLQRDQTVVTPQGTYIAPGYELGSINGNKPRFVEKAPTEGERKAGYVSDNLIDLENKVSNVLDDEEFDPTETKNVLAKVPGVGNFMASPQYRQYKAVSDEWTTNMVFLRSGATARPDEKDSTFQNFFPQPGDDKSTVKWKNKMRVDQMINAIHQGEKGGRVKPGEAKKMIEILKKKYNTSSSSSSLINNSNNEFSWDEL